MAMRSMSGAIFANELPGNALLLRTDIGSVAFPYRAISEKHILNLSLNSLNSASTGSAI